ncbi:hypothetical protein NHF48_002530 [Sphingomonas sp. H160509]|uniref:hypothetical protein n=1 Tax=Sphingomonas sp. H160509 TaxID=2955313 RepID=UPI0021E8E0AA|nr:hypothetical protein [Sphingomonas sp. H160509]MDD1450089.1 hypothetical protein [Sphingomonas sp. H160509]
MTARSGVDILSIPNEKQSGRTPPTPSFVMQKSKVVLQLAEDMDFKATRYAPSAKYPRIWNRSTLKVTCEQIDIGFFNGLNAAISAWLSTGVFSNVMTPSGSCSATHSPKSTSATAARWPSGGTGESIRRWSLEGLHYLRAMKRLLTIS